MIREARDSQPVLSWISELLGPVITKRLTFLLFWKNSYHSYLMPVSLLYVHYRDISLAFLVHRFSDWERVNSAATDVPHPTKFIHSWSRFRSYDAKPPPECDNLMGWGLGVQGRDTRWLYWAHGMDKKIFRWEGRLPQIIFFIMSTVIFQSSLLFQNLGTLYLGWTALETQINKKNTAGVMLSEVLEQVRKTIQLPLGFLSLEMHGFLFYGDFGGFLRRR